jgi:hypothetical protein
MHEVYIPDPYYAGPPWRFWIQSSAVWLRDNEAGADFKDLGRKCAVEKKDFFSYECSKENEEQN